MMGSKYHIFSYRVIYAYTIPDDLHAGLIKVADRLVTLEQNELREAENNPSVLEVFIEDFLPTDAKLAGIWLGMFKNVTGEKLSIKLQDIYRVLKEKCTPVALRKENKDIWFKADIADVEKAIKTAQRRESKEEDSPNSSSIIFRPEQNCAISDTMDAFGDKQRVRYLWNAKMRFGKTLCALRVAKDMGYKYTLIITHRPDVDDGWHKDFNKIFIDSTHHKYYSRNEKDKDSKGFVELIEKVAEDPDGRLVFFTSMQYLRGSHLTGGKKSAKYKENLEKTAILNFPWDFVVIDEAHEGTQSERGVEVMRYLKLNVPDEDPDSSDSKVSALDSIVQKTRGNDKSSTPTDINVVEKPTSPRDDRPITLSLSGTPFNLYSDYSPSEIFTWDYVKEQQAKANWHNEYGDDPNPYDVLPRLNIFNLDIEDTIGHRILEPGESEENCTKKLTDEELEEEYAGFNFSNFFKVWDKTLIKRHGKPESLEGVFVHETEIMEFFYSLAKETTEDSNFPFSTPEFRKAFKHTFWLIPGVPQGKALEELLKREKWNVRGQEVANPYFRDFRVINAAGSEQEDLTGKALQDVKDHIALTKGKMPERYDDENLDSLNKTKRKEYDDLKSKLPDWKGKYTITLSCGKLTTGVSVPDWTAVFYMKGNDSTSASTYMQTIFRVQTPAVIDGAQKTECYVFDFSPVRSLKVFADAVRLNMSSKLGNDKTTKYSREDQKGAIKKWLEVMPFEAINVPTPGNKTTRMEAYDADKLFSQLDAKLIDRVVRSGYADNSIYDSVAIMDLSDEAEAALARISLKITSDPKSNQEGGDIKWGKDKPKKPSKRQQDTARNAAGKDDKDLSPEEIAAKKAVDEWNKQRRERMKTLRSMSVRIPLLMYGAEISNLDELEITNFTQLVDDASWAEFMPPNITKEDFDAVRDCYDSVRFKGSAERIRDFAKTSDSLSITDRVKEVARIFSFFHNPDKETVLTPWRVVNMHMADTIGGYRFYADDNRTLLDTPVKVEQEKVTDSLFVTPSSGTFADLEKIHVLEINSKTGLYPLYVAYSLFRARKDFYEAAHALDPNMKVKEDHDIWEETLKENLFVVCKTPMAVDITRRTLAGFTGNQVNAICPTWEVPQEVLVKAGMIKDEGCMTLDPTLEVKTDLVGILRAKEEIEKENNRREKRGETPLDLIFTDQVQQRSWWEKTLHRQLDHNKFSNDMIKFNAVVGNPPYHLSSESSTRQDPIYHYFYQAAEKISPIYSLISPARFLFNGGLTPTEWNRHMLADKYVEVKEYFAKSWLVFPNTDIKGGIAVMLRNTYVVKNPIGDFSIDPIIGKLTQKFNPDYGMVSLQKIIIGGRSDLKFNVEFLNRYPQTINDRLAFIQRKRPNIVALGPNEEYELKSSTFDALPYIFKDKVSDTKKYYRILGLENGRRIWKYIERSYMTPRYENENNIENFKVFVSEANGNGQLGETLAKMEIGYPGDSATPTFISIGYFNRIAEVENCIKFIKTKFVRCLLGILKRTQHTPPSTWKFVPLQDFTEGSDIDWTQSVADIDKQLYKKYELKQPEIDFIEKMIKPMDD